MIALYVRISSEEQSKYSISSQLKECRRKAQSESVKEYVDDGFSGEFLDRPGLSLLRHDVREGIVTKIICYDPDRLSRKLMNQLILTDEFEKRGVEIVFVSGDYQKTPEGALFYQMRGAISEFEKAKITERTSRGRREKARQGKILRDFQVYGYGYDKESASFYIDEDESEIVKLIFDLFTSPNTVVRGINGIAKYLTDKDVPTKRGAGVWHRQVVRQILMNRSYIGEFYQNRWNTEGMLGNKHREPEDKVKMKERPREDWIRVDIPPIIDHIQFEHAQRLMGEVRRRWAKQGTRDYLLSGILRCGDCGNTLTGRSTKNWGKHVLEYTDIKNTAGAKQRGCGLVLKCADLDTLVWEHVDKYLNNYEAIMSAEMEVAASTYEVNELERVTKQLEKAKEGRKRLIKLFAKGDMDFGEDEIRAELKALKEEEEKLEIRKAELEEHFTTDQGGENSKRILQEAAGYYFGIGAEELTFDDKKNLIRYVVREVVVTKDTMMIHTW
jgi:site-specific DNA recombinase